MDKERVTLGFEIMGIVIAVLSCIATYFALIPENLRWPFAEITPSLSSANPTAVSTLIPALTPTPIVILETTSPIDAINTPLPNPWLRLLEPEDGRTFTGRERTTVILRWSWPSDTESVDHFKIWMMGENIDWFVLWGSIPPDERSGQFNFQELSGTFYWKVTATVDATTYTSEVNTIGFGP